MNIDVGARTLPSSDLETLLLFKYRPRQLWNLVAPCISRPSPSSVYRWRTDDRRPDLRTICADESHVILPMWSVVRQRSTLYNTVPIIVDLRGHFSVGLAIDVGNEQKSITGCVDVEARLP